MKESYENITHFLSDVQYSKYFWNFYGDLEVISTCSMVVRNTAACYVREMWRKE